jgi:hypothetical protein
VLVSSLEGLVVDSHLHPHGGWALREKSLVPGSQAGDNGGHHYLLGGIILDDFHSLVHTCFSTRRVCGCRGSDPEWIMFERRGGGLVNHGGQQLHGVELLLAMA